MSPANSLKGMAIIDDRDPSHDTRFPNGIEADRGSSSTVNLIVTAHNSEQRGRKELTEVESRTNQVALVLNWGK